MNKKIPLAIKLRERGACPPILVNTTFSMDETRTLNTTHRVKFPICKSQKFTKEIMPRMKEKVASHELENQPPKHAGQKCLCKFFPTTIHTVNHSH